MRAGEGVRARSHRFHAAERAGTLVADERDEFANIGRGQVRKPLQREIAKDPCYATLLDGELLLDDLVFAVEVPILALVFDRRLRDELARREERHPHVLAVGREVPKEELGDVVLLLDLRSGRRGRRRCCCHDGGASSNPRETARLARG